MPDTSQMGMSAGAMLSLQATTAGAGASGPPGNFGPIPLEWNASASMSLTAAVGWVNNPILRAKAQARPGVLAKILGDMGLTAANVSQQLTQVKQGGDATISQASAAASQALAAGMTYSGDGAVMPNIAPRSGGSAQQIDI